MNTDEPKHLESLKRNPSTEAPANPSTNQAYVQAGRYRCRICLVVILIWPVMAVVAPFVVVGVSAGLPMMPAIGVFLLLGALWERTRTVELTN